MRPRRTKCNRRVLSMMGLPMHLHSLSLSDLDISDSVKDYVTNYIENLDKNFKHNKGIFFFGSNGTGKTTTASIILRECYMRRYTFRRVTFNEYIEVYTRAWSCKDFDEKESIQQELIEKYKGVEFLCLEEIGKENDTKLAITVLEDLLRYREDFGLPIIICTNLTFSMIKERYGDSICSLIKGSCNPIKLVGEDRR